MWSVQRGFCRKNSTLAMTKTQPVIHAHTHLKASGVSPAHTPHSPTMQLNPPSTATVLPREKNWCWERVACKPKQAEFLLKKAFKKYKQGILTVQDRQPSKEEDLIV